MNKLLPNEYNNTLIFIEHRFILVYINTHLHLRGMQTTRAIGHKWPIPICFLFYIIWMGANGYAVWGTMLPASVMVGLAAAPLWTSQCSYFTKVGSGVGLGYNKILFWGFWIHNLTLPVC